MKQKKPIDPLSKQMLSGKLFFIAGPCVIESESLCMKIADRLAKTGLKNKVTIIFKASWDKANRTSKRSFRGPGKENGLEILNKVKQKTGLPLLTDVHETNDIRDCAEIADIIQIPAFLCRQTTLLNEAGKTGLWVNVKKGQFLSPQDIPYVIEKTGNKCMITERGTFFGYNRLVVDFAGIIEMKYFGVPIIFDATHSVQKPGGSTGKSGGNREYVIPLALSAICQKINGLFFEVHPNPDKALCDGANSLELKAFEKNIPRFLQLHEMVKEW